MYYDIYYDEYGNTYLYPQHSTLEYLPQVVYQVMSLSIFAQSLGLIVAASGLALTTPVSALAATDPAIEELRKAYGDQIVSKALADVPDAKAIELAQRVEHYVYEDLKKRYGDWAAQIAIDTAPPGDMSTAIAIAQTLSQRNVTRNSSPAAKTAAVARGKLRGRHAAEPVRDTKTGVVYASKGAAGKALAGEYIDTSTGKPLDSSNKFVYYAIIKKDPNRLVPA